METVATISTKFTIWYDTIKTNGVKKHTAKIYANGKKVFTATSTDKEVVKKEATVLITNLSLYGYSPEKPVGAHEQVWYLFRELKDAGKLNYQIRAAVLLQRHTWNEEQALAMLETLKEIKNA
ncbi:hypothetical protein [Rufibacter quisquiliarum]|uniref:Uncharacterized protein n=1 Tax=Rufibacter quisquiliarum TaxID=1549639 RepID=A0A839GAZ7_9BACT|nr:hypothetical protein [Rufibacter quisquiliarum]MBA9076102.1 hypothetical protein [Rufibacter quisquiliarum]